MADHSRSTEARAWRRLYRTPAWKAARSAQLANHPLCERCERAGRITPATVVHHRKAHKGDWQLFIDPDNHESLCAPCHDGPVQQSERIGYETTIGVDGWPVDLRHPVNS